MCLWCCRYANNFKEDEKNHHRCVPAADTRNVTAAGIDLLTPDLQVLASLSQIS